MSEPTESAERMEVHVARRPRKCPICRDVKAAVWVQMLLEKGFSPRRIARAKPEAGYGFSRPQVVRHINECREYKETA